MSKWAGIFEFQVLSAPDGAGGRTIVGLGGSHNNLADEGEFNVLRSYLTNEAHPSSFFIKLWNDTVLDTDSLRSLNNEPGGAAGYASQQVLRSATASGWSLGWSGGDAQASSKQVTFDCIAPYTVTYATLATTSDNSGNLVSYAALPSSKTLASGEQLKITYKPSLS